MNEMITKLDYTNINFCFSKSTHTKTALRGFSVTNVSLRFLSEEELTASLAGSVVGSQPEAVRSFRNDLCYTDLPCPRSRLFLGWHIS